MPAYTYRCTTPDCGTDTTRRYPITDTHPATVDCDTCGAPARKAFHATPAILKGTGFYSTANRPPRYTTT